MLRAHTSRRWLAAGLTLASIVLAACEADRVFDPDQSGYSLLTPPSASVIVGASVPLAARVVRNGTDTITVADAIWKSSDTTVATIIPGPALKAKRSGLATISVDWSAQHAQMTLTVQDAPVATVRVAPTSFTMVPGDTRTIAATPLDVAGNALTGRAVTWTSSNNSVATVSPAGTITAVAVGSASVVASIEGITASAPVTVGPAPVWSVAVQLNAPSVTVGQSVQASAVLRDARDNVLTGRSVTWSSNNTSVATVDAAGLVRGVGVGTASITASSEGVQGQAALSVTTAPVASVALQPASFTIAVAVTQQVQATTRDGAGNVLTGRTVTWSSNATGVATVDAAGLVRGIAAGTALITATSEGVSQQATATVVAPATPVPSVSPASATVYIGGTTTLTAVMRDGSGNTVPATFTWSSGNTGIATVDANGRVTGVASGTVTITATADGKSASAQVTVAPVPVSSVTITPTSLSLQAGATGQLAATCRDSAGGALTGRTVTWSSSATGTATVNAVGLVTSVAPGSAQVTATCEGRTASATVTVTAVPVATVTVTPATATVRIGSTVALAATTRDAAGNTLTGRTITWSSSSTAIATVSSAGVVTPVAVGTATITATSEGRTGTSTITVQPPAVASVTLSPGALSLVAGNSGSLTATARDASGNAIAGATFTWSTDDAATATVSNGVVTAVRVGSTIVRATADGISGTASISVSAPQTAGNIVDPTLLPKAVGQTRAAGSYGRTLTAGQTYADPNTNVTVLKVTDNRTPVANSGMYHGYSEGGPFISQAWTGTDGGTYYTLWLAWGDGWFVDVKYPAMTMSNWRAAPVSAEIEGTFSLNPATPRIFYYSGSNTLNRWDTQTNRLANVNGFPFNIPTSNGTYFTWIQTQINDNWIVGMLGSNSTIVGIRPSDGTTRYITTAASGLDIDEPHIDREQPVVYVSASGNDPQNVIYNLNTNTRVNPRDTQGIVNDDHNAPMRGKIAGVSWQSNATVLVDWQGNVTKIPGASPTNWAGDFHTAGQWVFDNPNEYFMLDQWQSGGNWPIALGMIGLQSVGGDVRLLVAHDGTGGGYQSGGQPHMTFAPDGKLVMWTSNMNGSGRFDVFLAKMPTR